MEVKAKIFRELSKLAKANGFDFVTDPGGDAYVQKGFNTLVKVTAVPRSHGCRYIFSPKDGSEVDVELSYSNDADFPALFGEFKKVLDGLAG